MKKFFVLCFLIVLLWQVTPTPNPTPLTTPKIDVGFTPSQECEQKIGALIENSQETIDVVIYSLNNQYLVAQLKRAHDRGVKVRILADKLQASGKYSKVTELKDYGLDIKVNSKHKIEHNKFAIFDSAVVSTGSYNWTNAASLKNSENCLFLREDPQSLAKYKERFEELWLINSQEKSDAWFEKRKNKK